jgi:plasmid stabilization system protein ParE
MRVEFLPAAQQEFIEIADDYERLVAGLGDEFVAEGIGVSAILSRHPFIGLRVDPIHRRIPFRRFPFAYLFRSDPDAIRIVAVAHRRRRPDYWRKPVR